MAASLLRMPIFKQALLANFFDHRWSAPISHSISTYIYQYIDIYSSLVSIREREEDVCKYIDHPYPLYSYPPIIVVAIASSTRSTHILSDKEEVVGSPFGYADEIGLVRVGIPLIQITEEIIASCCDGTSHGINVELINSLISQTIPSYKGKIIDRDIDIYIYDTMMIIIIEWNNL